MRTTLSPAEKECCGTLHINHLAASFDGLLMLYPMRGKITIKGAPCNAQARTDTVYRDRAGCVELQRHRKCLGIDGFAPSTFPAPPSRTGQSCQGPLPHEIAFKFGKRPRDLEKADSTGFSGKMPSY